MGTNLKELSESYPMNTNMTRFGCFSKIFASLCLGESSLSTGRVNHVMPVAPRKMPDYFGDISLTKAISGK